MGTEGEDDGLWIPGGDWNRDGQELAVPLDPQQIPAHINEGPPDLRLLELGFSFPLAVSEGVDDGGSGADGRLHPNRVEIRMLRAQGGVKGLDDREDGSFAAFQGVVDGLPLDVGAGLHQGADLRVLLEPESQADCRHRAASAAMIPHPPREEKGNLSQNPASGWSILGLWTTCLGGEDRWGFRS
jgi:hypothetical protein